jgi:hypothetical protein
MGMIVRAEGANSKIAAAQPMATACFRGTRLLIHRGSIISVQTYIVLELEKKTVCILMDQFYLFTRVTQFNSIRFFPNSMTGGQFSTLK